MGDPVRTIGFVGLGAMGTPMARALLAAGFTVRGADVRASALDELAAAGGVACASAAEAAKGADTLLLMVVNAAQAEAVLFGAGALAALPDGGIVVLMATCPPAAVAAIAEKVLASGRRFVDSPVSGGVAGAKAASLTIMAAADDATFAAIRPVFDALGKRIFHVGDKPGQGAVVKTVNQLLCGAHIAVAAEGLALAQKLGVNAALLLDVMGDSSAASWMLRDRGPRMLQAETEVTSAVDIFVKDLGIVLQAGRDAGAALPMAALAHQLFLATSGRGDGSADDSQVIRCYQLLNGMTAKNSTE